MLVALAWRAKRLWYKIVYVCLRMYARVYPCVCVHAGSSPPAASVRGDAAIRLKEAPSCHTTRIARVLLPFRANGITWNVPFRTVDMRPCSWGNGTGVLMQKYIFPLIAGAHGDKA